MYFRRKVNTLEFKVNTLFKLVQDHMENQQQQNFNVSHNMNPDHYENVKLQQEEDYKHQPLVVEEQEYHENKQEKLIEVSESESETESESESETETESEGEGKNTQTQESKIIHLGELNIQDLQEELDVGVEEIVEEVVEEKEGSHESEEEKDTKTIELVEDNIDYSKYTVPKLRELILQQDPNAAVSKLKKTQLLEMLN